MAEEEVWHPQETLQTDLAQRKLWLVKVIEQGVWAQQVRHPLQHHATAPPRAAPAFLLAQCRP